ncbi:DUF2249 domain-containing protein [Actinomadura keratinilytica]|jgi:uncharacterized protein (DUF2249 family)|uniref:DUF2249 domain-containing protein n=1 Tax=Actinomadura keratinilytica TaxID=547461 RepID=A0ABP7YX58_9ACTN
MTAQATESQRATVQAIREHHGRLGRTMADHALTVRRGADQLAELSGPRTRMVEFSRAEVLPHAAVENETLYRAAWDVPAARLLVQAMIREHELLRELVDDLERARTAGETAGAAVALNAMFQAHLEKENEMLLPALVEAGVDLAGALGGRHEVLGESAEAGEGGCTCGGCTCGGHDAPGTPGATAELIDGELDVRALAPAQRHEQIFAAFRALPPGGAFVLVNDHDPKPLSYQFAAEYPGLYTWDYLEAGPQVWRVRIGRP